MASLSSSSSSTKKSKLSVKNQTHFKKSPFLSARETTILKKAVELSILCDNEICVLHYDRDGGLVNTLPQDQSQVKDILERYNNLSDGEKIKKNTNLSQFCNKKLMDEKKRSLTDANVHKKFTKKVGDFKGSLADKLLMLKDMTRYLAVMSEENLNFPATSSGGFFLPNDFSSSLIEDPLNFFPPVTDATGDHVSTNTDQYLPSPAVYNSVSTATNSSCYQSKFSVFLFNHETSMLTQLPNSVTSSFDQRCSNNIFNFGSRNNLCT